jgi:hypothetical protein
LHYEKSSYEVFEKVVRDLHNQIFLALIVFTLLQGILTTNSGEPTFGHHASEVSVDQKRCDHGFLNHIDVVINLVVSVGLHLLQNLNCLQLVMLNEDRVNKSTYLKETHKHA